ncbi:MAG TPA: endonuclease III [Candidatus Omnitrophica bacterium]|nr:endonuclease III [Candidatus Omnitrophota bacterium]
MPRIDEILRLLKKKYPAPAIALGSKNPWELLVATILSAQCTDVRVNLVTAGLFKEYRSIKDYAKADPESFRQAIRPTGFYRNKAKNIIACANKILKDFGGKVPDDMGSLLTLPGVARKTANVVLYNAFGKNEGIAVDTHVNRVSQRLGLAKSSDPLKIEQELLKQLERREWGDFSLRLILHGRQTCIARRPKCPECVLGAICPSKKIFYPSSR